MQHFDRGTEPPPSVLQGDAADRSRRSLRDFMRYGNEKRSQTNFPRSEQPLDDVSMRESLGKLFRGRCAFCEAQEEIVPYRFRPVAEAIPSSTREQAHLYYAWLENAWENIYAICPSCHPTEPNYFPVSGTRVKLPNETELDRYVEENLGLWREYPIREKAVFLDPCGDGEFYQSLWPQRDGVLRGLSPRGKSTIQFFNLNAYTRIEARRSRYDEYFARLVESLTQTRTSERAEELFAFSALEFGGTWYLLLRRLALLIGAEFGVKPIVSRPRIQRFYLTMFGKVDTAERLKRGWWHLEQEEGNVSVDSSPPIKRPSTATISEIRLKNFKAIEDLTVSLSTPSGERGASFDVTRPVPSLLIIGDNSAGKSSILEAIALTLSDAKARTKLGLDAKKFVLNPSYLGDGTANAIEKSEVEVKLTSGASHTLTITLGRMEELADATSEVVPVFAYGAFRQYQKKQRPRSPDKYIRNLFDGSLLSNPERWLLSLKPDEYAMVMRALREILSIEGDFEVVRRDLQENQCYMITAVPGTDSENQFSRTPLSIVSSGFRSVLAMACDVMQGLMDPRVFTGFETLSTARGVVLIDEVEAHLHPRWKMQIMRGLRRALPQMTFIATTHDPLCLRGMEDGEIVVLQRVAAKYSQTPTELPVIVEQLRDLPHVSELRIEQLLTSDFFQLYSTDAPEIDSKLAEIGDLLAKDIQELNLAEKATVDSFQRDLAAALPIGASEAHRLVQEAVADYLKERRAASDIRMKELKQEAKTRIINALRGI